MTVAHGRLLRARHQGFAATRGRPEVSRVVVLNPKNGTSRPLESARAACYCSGPVALGPGFDRGVQTEQARYDHE